MKIAVPVYDENLKIFENTGHTPYFAIFKQVGEGMFKKIDLLELRENPRANIHANKGCSHKDEDMSQEEQIAHKKEHDVLGEIIKDCQVVLVKMACKNTAKVFNECGIKICRVAPQVTFAKDSFAHIRLS
ncbi:hypothetical protein B6S12_09020 [Helicobacter valdiviensis]|uniref:Dinitrogenase iron-molybdenum cofactor biosynthesis domain-containing protein n=1 Tax=Helicobacter valdiviensis TaxID=1458358 RepID=A0A2W6PLB7_9HELI|nr:hypothetical protein [Helicobacter valdiviensis]PZT47443.1 hypothetical protein B6S12_09020 [Helicobacter valdiviensis]